MLPTTGFDHISINLALFARDFLGVVQAAIDFSLWIEWIVDDRL